MAKIDLHIGMKLYRPVYSKYTEPKEGIMEYTVSYIGKKYFECDDLTHDKFVIETLKKYSPNYSQNEFQLYTSIQEIEYKKQVTSLSTEIRYLIGQYGDIKLPLEKLKQVHEIITNK